jgi:D-sedoheptulose 7-phosphate isomerase
MPGGDIVKSVREFVDDYYARFVEVLDAFDKGSLEEIAGVLMAVAEAEGTLWVAGNGGSAAISDHTVCDATKLPYVEGQPILRSVSLASNGPMLTALGNDFSYGEVFSRQLAYYLSDGDALLVVSSSGNSPNVVAACEYAKGRGAPTIAFVGFAGGKLAELADHVVHVPVDNYGMAEDTHQSVMHVLTQYLTALNKSRA